jgi:hypothetical protein
MYKVFKEAESQSWKLEDLKFYTFLVALKVARKKETNSASGIRIIIAKFNTLYMK